MGERRAPAWLEQADQYLEKTKSNTNSLSKSN